MIFLFIHSLICKFTWNSMLDTLSSLFIFPFLQNLIYYYNLKFHLYKSNYQIYIATVLFSKFSSEL